MRKVQMMNPSHALPLVHRLNHIALDELGVEGLAERSWTPLDNDTGSLEGGDLGVSATLTTADNGT